MLITALLNAVKLLRDTAMSALTSTLSAAIAGAAPPVTVHPSILDVTMSR
jgi:hypothetical protein